LKVLPKKLKHSIAEIAVRSKTLKVLLKEKLKNSTAAAAESS
jgi:hypothetical protein